MGYSVLQDYLPGLERAVGPDSANDLRRRMDEPSGGGVSMT
jgi:hypothetical protein